MAFKKKGACHSRALKRDWSEKPNKEVDQKKADGVCSPANNPIRTFRHASPHVFNGMTVEKLDKKEKTLLLYSLEFKIRLDLAADL